MASKTLLLAGAGGHAKVVADAARLSGWRVVGAVDPNPSGAGAKLSGLKILGADADLPRLRRAGTKAAAIGLGSVRDTGPRRRVRLALTAAGFELPAIVHPSAVVAASAELGAGAQVLARAVLNPGARVGAGAVVNTGAIVEHDATLGDDAFVGPGAVIGGQAVIGDGAFIGLGARILQGVKIGAAAVVGIGAVVLRDVPPGIVVAGVPAKPLRSPR